MKRIKRFFSLPTQEELANERKALYVGSLTKTVFVGSDGTFRIAVQTKT